MNDPIDTKTMRSLVEAANHIDRTDGIAEASQEDAKKVGVREDLRKRLMSAFKPCGTDLSVHIADSVIQVYFNYGGKRQSLLFLHMNGRWTVNLSSPVLQVSTIDENHTASKAIRAHAEHFINLSGAVRNAEALLTGFYDIGDLVSR